MTERGKTPVCLLSGFLGAGKTTFLNKILQHPDFADTLVIINEFGETSLDHLLVEKSSETIFELANGCLCCNIRGELVDTLLTLDRTRFKRIIIETTGIADPLPVFQSIAFHGQLAQDYKPATITIVVDAQQGQKIIESHDEAAKQLACADNIVVSKQDLVDDPEPIKAFLKENAPTANMIDMEKGFSIHNFERASAAKPHQHDHNHAVKYSSIILETHSPLSQTLIAKFTQHLANIYGENLLRIKGLALDEQNPEKPIIVQVTGQILHDFARLETWPNETQKTELVVIIQGSDIEPAKQAFNSYMNNLSIDTADRLAITDNPLSIPGF